MTQQTGNNPEAPKEQMPWEMNWTLKAKQAVVSAVDDAKAVVSSIKMPWEMNWKEKTVPTSKSVPPAPVEAPIAPPAPLPNEAAMKKATSDLFTPAANAKRKAQEQNPKNIAELQAEIDRTKDPAQKKILTDYMNSLMRK